MITDIEIIHYRSISHARLKLNPINIIVGANGSGKSNILDAIFFLHDCCENDIDTALTRRHGIDYVRQWSRSKPFHISIEAGFRNFFGTGRYKLTLSSYKKTHRIVEENATWEGMHPRDRYSTSRKYPDGKSVITRTRSGTLRILTTHPEIDTSRLPAIPPTSLFLSYLSSSPFMGGLVLFSDIVRELKSFALYSIYPNTLRLPQLISREKSLTDDGSNLASILKGMPQARKAEIISGINAIMPAVADYKVESAGGFYVPSLLVKEASGDSHFFGLSQISDGTLRVLGILTALYQPRAPDKIGLEEPEQMVHPGALEIIAEAIKDFAKGRNDPEDEAGQMFVTTHSPHLIDMFDPESIIWTRKNDGITEAGHVSDRQMRLIKDSLFTPGELLLSEGIF